MDVLSVTPSLITVLAAAQACIKGAQNVKDYRKAPHEIAGIVEELEYFASLLEDVQKTS